MKQLLVFPMVIFSILAGGQPNCNVYKIKNNIPCLEACTIATEGEGPQGSRESQLKFDAAIELCPTFDYAWSEKAVPYLKRGDFVSWKKLIDKAVAIDPMGHLGYRGWCRYQFVRDYQGAIKDFETLDSLTAFDIGYSQNGDYQLNIAKALCYKALGQKSKAIQIIEDQLSQKGYTPLLFDYLHLGVLKMETGDAKGAVESLKKSIATNDYLAEPYYYLGLIYKQQHLTAEARLNMEKAKAYYLKGYKRFDPYTSPMDKIYLADIDRALSANQ